MVVVDANVLLYAVNEDLARHDAARRWIETALNGDEPVGFAWIAMLAFVRVSTQSTLTEQPLDVEVALDVVDEWIGAPAATIVEPTTRHLSVLRGLLTEAGTAGNLTNDAHLAALAIEHGGTVCTFDTDFDRFEGVRWFTPS